MDKYIYNTCTLSENITIMCSKRLKLSLWKNKFDFLPTMYIVLKWYIQLCQKVHNNSKIVLKRTETRNEIPSFFQECPLSQPQYTVTISYCSLWRNQVPGDYYLSTRRLKQLFILYHYCIAIEMMAR